MAKMKKETVKIYGIEAMKQMVNCPAWAQVNQDFADGKFKAAVGVSKSPVGYYLNVDGDATNTFARITKVTKDDGTEVVNPLEIASLLDDYISKDHEVNNLSITGSVVTGDFCQVKITTTTRKKTTSKVSSASGSYADVMQEHIDEMIALGAMVKEDGDLILQILDEHKITNDALLCEKIYRYWKNHFEKFGKKDPKQIKVPKPYYKDPALEEEIQTNGEGIVSEGIRCALSGHGVIAQGGKSVGKNVWTDTLAFILYVPISLLTFSRQMAPSALYGDKSTDNSAIEELYSDAAVAAAKAAVQGDDLEKAVQFELMKARASSVRIVQDQSELYDALQYGRLMCFNGARCW